MITSLDPNLSIVIATIVVSLAAAFIALIYNRPTISKTADEDNVGMGTVFDNPQSVLPHLNELRSRVIRSLFAIGVATGIAAALYEPLLQVLAAPIGGLGNLSFIGVTEPFRVIFRVALTFGIILASPFALSQVWIFVASGLKSNERRLFVLLFPFAALMFVVGIAFSYFVILPTAVPFLVEIIPGVDSKPILDDYIGFVTTVMLVTGLTFEMPLAMFVLAKFGVVNTGMLIKNWRIAVVVIAIVSAVATPTPDPVNMALFAGPMILLYLLSIVLTLFA